jgi:hypothetical protein
MSSSAELLMLIVEDALMNSCWRVKAPVLHYLKTCAFGCHTIYVLSSANTLVILLVLLQIKNIFVLVFILTLITKMFYM